MLALPFGVVYAVLFPAELAAHMHTCTRILEPQLVHCHAQDILRRTQVQPGKVAAFVELHIEQGPLLEEEGVRLGVVSAIAAPAALRVRFSGDGGHAGAQLMPLRCPFDFNWGELSEPGA